MTNMEGLMAEKGELESDIEQKASNMEELKQTVSALESEVDRLKISLKSAQENSEKVFTSDMLQQSRRWV